MCRSLCCELMMLVNCCCTMQNGTEVAPVEDISTLPLSSGIGNMKITVAQKAGWSIFNSLPLNSSFLLLLSTFDFQDSFLLIWDRTNWYLPYVWNVIKLHLVVPLNQDMVGSETDIQGLYKNTFRRRSYEFPLLPFHISLETVWESRSS